MAQEKGRFGRRAAHERSQAMMEIIDETCRRRQKERREQLENRWMIIELRIIKDGFYNPQREALEGNGGFVQMNVN